MEAPKIQSLMLDELACLIQVIERICIIENLFHSLSNRVRALKRDGVRAQWMVCSMAIFKNIKSGRIVAKNLGVDRRFLCKAMKKRGKLLSFNMPLWGIEEQFPRSDSLGVSVKELVQGW